jgi:aminocarboxymuconate-semialdehyde decarboxylase
VGELGLRGVEIGSHVNGRNLDDRGLWPFYGRVERLGVPIMIHPAEPPGRDRLSRYQLVNFIGFPLETTIAGASLIFGGVLKDFPNLKVYFVHGGGFLPYQRGRFEHGYEVREDPKTNIKKPPSQYFKLLYFDALTHDQQAMEYLISSVSPRKVMLGTDYPADMTDPDLVGKIQRVRTISESDKERILWGNAAELFKLD